MVGVPPKGIGLVLGVDRFLDMCRTTLNVTGDLVAATVVSTGEKDLDLAEHDPDISAEEKMARLPETQDQERRRPISEPLVPFFTRTRLRLVQHRRQRHATIRSPGLEAASSRLHPPIESTQL